MKNIISKIVLVSIICLVVSYLDAQCPMCRMSAESNLKAGGSSGKGLNAGILYMLLTPYIAVCTIAYVWWRNRRKENEIMSNQEINFSDN